VGQEYVGEKKKKESHKAATKKSGRLLKIPQWKSITVGEKRVFWGEEQTGRKEKEREFQTTRKGKKK